MNEIYAQALADISSENYEKALLMLEILVQENNYIPALNKLGIMYGHGVGVKKNYDKGCNYLIKAMKEGSIEATHNLATLKYDAGDYDNSVQLYEKAVKKKYLPSMYRLAWIYENKELPYFNAKKSLELFKSSAKKGHVYSQGAYIRRILRGKYGTFPFFLLPYLVIKLIYRSIKYRNYDPRGYLTR